MWRLFYPLRYFALLNPEKRHLDLWPTLALTAIIAVPYIVFPSAVFFHKDGFLDKLILLTSALSGFYVAALVAVATFPSPDLDKPITVGPIKIRMRDADGKSVEEHLSRREFTTTIFGYLAFNALILSLFTVIAIPLSDADVSWVTNAPWIGAVFTQEHLIYWRGALVIVFAAATAHLIIGTCLGLYYLMGRVYRREPKVISKKSDQEAA